MEKNHHTHPELWFRPSPALPFEVLSELFKKGEIIATPRLGKRDGTHPKGYVLGTVATLRLYDDAGREQFCRRIRIGDIAVKPLHDFSEAELERTHYPADWQSLQQDFSYFEERSVAADELVSIVEFSYLNQEE